MKKTALSLLVAALAAGAAFDAARWQYRRQVPAAPANHLAGIAVDRAVLAAARDDLGDLRLTAAGVETPYILLRLAASVEERELRLRILNKAVTGGSALELTLDFGRRTQHSGVRFSTQEQNFRNPVRIETSDDMSSWATAREDGYIFDFTTTDRKFSVLSVDYPASTRRYARVTVTGFTKSTSLTDAWAVYRHETPAEREPIATLEPARSEDPDTKASLLVFDLGRDLPHDRLELETGPGSFHRAAELETSPDNKEWRYAARATLYQIPGERSLGVAHSERRDRYLRLRIFNGDNAPVPVARARVQVTRRVLKFPAQPGAVAWLYYGNPDSKPPQYDLAALLSRQDPLPEHRLALPDGEPNPAYVPPPPKAKPFSERYPGLLRGALVVAILGMGWVTVRFLRKIRTPAG